MQAPSGPVYTPINGPNRAAASSQRARAAATSEWEGKARSRYGKRFASLSRAQGVHWNCKSTLLKATCAVSARPCR